MNMKDKKTFGQGFTLIELLVVIAIIGILVGLLLPAIQMARQYARVVKAKAEVKQIETAWRAYYQEYQTWPTNTALTADSNGDLKGPISGVLFNIMQGNNSDTAAAGNNPRNFAFMTFKNGGMNPWWTSSSPSNVDYYYVKFDANFDNSIALGDTFEGVTTTGPNGATAVRAPVVVWTINPNGSGTSKLIASWQ
jgi:prepilin-type N-terminal cleavage/methylation domain-containing protein